MIECPWLYVSPDAQKQYMSAEVVKRIEERVGFIPMQGCIGSAKCVVCSKFVMFIGDDVLCGFPYLQNPQLLISMPL